MGTGLGSGNGSPGLPNRHGAALGASDEAGHDEWPTAPKHYAYGVEPEDSDKTADLDHSDLHPVSGPSRRPTIDRLRGGQHDAAGAGCETASGHGD